MERYEGGTCCSIDDAVRYLKECNPRDTKDDMPERIINRLLYVRDKDAGVKPTFRKGIYGHKYDQWTCGHCGAVTKDGVGDSYCRNCGYRILWDSTRCLTGR